ncbi:DNA sulfur modification protein DndD [Treponema bryantii]|uniref:DNA sulfur modification protein DndD n=1 Tax=Treponema bryantii TaxID=163 RepID=A0A1I3LL63_9SPIR|nr:AAA family ATPase [Treponema bryantii]SFI85453.1 DNA sulfur modification protein DndD [Treponema bryantii]
MLLTQITLKDFRQFRGTQTIVFSTDPDKNVTIILGENGAGKTTFAQAFKWCLYGSTDFRDPIVLNKKVSNDLGPSAETTVSVELNLIHRKRPYIITREQKYTTNSQGDLNTPNSSVLKIKYKADNGETEFVPENEVELRIKEILPQELSKYFFFDGERINNMSKELTYGKSDEFADAVRRLLGLAAFSNTLNHLYSKHNANSVIKSYNNDYDSKANSKIAEYKTIINKLDADIEIGENRKNEIENKIRDSKNLQAEYNAQMAKFKESEALINRKAELESLISACQSRHTSQVDNLFCSFDKNILSWICQPIIKDVVKEFNETKIIDKGIPDITAKTIDFLIEQGKCICGNCISKESKEYKELQNLLQFIPPKSLGTFIGQFVTEANMRVDAIKDYYDPNFLGKFGDIRSTVSEIEDYQNEINTIDEKLRGQSGTSNIQSKYDEEERKIREYEQEKEDVIEKLGKNKGEKERIESQLQELVLKDSNNRAIATYKAYAQYMYNYLSELYNKKETEVRNKLQDNINKIFKTIYDGKLSVLIDERYNIKIVADDFVGYKGTIETSTAQSMSVIFAFITGVIKMAKENNEEADSEMKLESEAYPLVMDAPLSSFDKKRVSNVCEAIPNIAEQVIMFSFDKDAEIAKKNMGNKLGKSYEFIKNDEFETSFKEM